MVYKTAFDVESPDTLRMFFSPYLLVLGVWGLCVANIRKVHACPYSLQSEVWPSAHSTLDVYLFTSQIFELLCSGSPRLKLGLMYFVSNLHNDLGVAPTFAILGQGEAPGNAGSHYTQNVESSF